MDRSDLQIGDTWTHPDHRGRGLAATALRYLLSTQGQPGRTFWYLTEADNTASIRVADRSGLRWVGDGEKCRRFGLGLLGAYVLNSPTKGNNAMYPVLKRALDFSLAFVALTLLSPVLLFVALCIKLGSQGPIFYRGTRIGRNGVPFAMLKFRTMVINADQIGASSTAEDDPRITPQGRWLRRFKLDELPQFINVLLGQMSFVGPRPQVGWAVDLYTPEERALLTVRPGITDYASLYYRNEGEILRGSLDPDKDYLEKIAPGKIRLGLEYVRTSSLLVDIKIMLATPLAIAGVDPAWCLPPMFAVTESTIRPQVVEKEVVNQ
jgi:lipopolysaccharide/colanic/teichoic acid biosynthesis glycosyltransferase